MPRINALALVLAATVAASVAGAQTSITLFGQEYSVVRINYSDALQVPRLNPSAPRVPLIESEGLAWAGEDKLIFSADDLGDVATNTNENWVVEAQLIEEGCQITGMTLSRVITSFPEVYRGFDLNPTGVAYNATTYGYGHGGNVITDGEAVLTAFSAQAGQENTILGFPSGAPCESNPFYTCGMDISSRNNNDEDVCFAQIPPDGMFLVVNQDLPSVERWNATTGAFMGDFVVGFSLEQGSHFYEAKGVTYSVDSELLPASIRTPTGTVLVAFDSGYPGLQAFDVNGTFLGEEALTVNGTPGGASRLDIEGCFEQLHLESLAIDPATGRIFLSNQGSLTFCNYLWVLTPTTYSCSTCAPCAADFDNNGGIDGADLAAFFGAYEAGEVCGDVDSNGGIDGADLAYFFGVYEAGGC